MMRKNILPFCLLLLSVAVFGCRKKPLPTNTNPNNTDTTLHQHYGDILIDVKNMVGSRPLVLGALAPYSLANGDQFTVSEYNYYISNLVFVRADGTRFVDSNSYYLVKQSDTNTLHIRIDKVPIGNYTQLELLIGVDSLRNVSGVQDGFLSPSYGMFWTWSTGYIMAKLEGTSPQSTNPGNSIMYHIAGFKGEFNVLQNVKLNTPVVLTVAEAKATHLLLQSNILTWFESFTFPGFAAKATIATEGVDAYNMSQSYANMFSIGGVQNP